MKRVLWQNDGFTLIELLMVVIILGILAAVVVPQFTSSSEDAKVSALKSNLAGIRGALELYLVQHDSQYPDAANLVNQLTQYTDQNGYVSTVKTGPYKFGPYLKQGFPKNPYMKDQETADDIEIVSDPNVAIGTVRATDPPARGWKYVVSTGEFIANTPNYDHY